MPWIRHLAPWINHLASSCMPIQFWWIYTNSIYLNFDKTENIFLLRNHILILIINIHNHLRIVSSILFCFMFILTNKNIQMTNFLTTWHNNNVQVLLMSCRIHGKRYNTNPTANFNELEIYEIILKKMYAIFLLSFGSEELQHFL